MLNSAKIAKVTVVWMTILYIICTLIAAILPGIYAKFAGLLVHFGAVSQKPNITFLSAIVGLIVWDIVVYIAVWLFVAIYNRTK